MGAILWRVVGPRGLWRPGTRTTKACAKCDFSFCPCKALCLFHSRASPLPKIISTHERVRGESAQHPGFNGTAWNLYAWQIGHLRAPSHPDRPRILDFARCIMPHATIIALAGIWDGGLCGTKATTWPRLPNSRIPLLNVVGSYTATPVGVQVGVGAL